jgi:conjugative relaxase-like TrwC/TraI family protein
MASISTGLVTIYVLGTEECIDAGHVGGDKRLIDAHNRAVTVALEQVESLASTRVQKDGVSETVLTGNLIIARFNHDTSRAQEPQIHAQRGHQRDAERG